MAAGGLGPFLEQLVNGEWSLYHRCLSTSTETGVRSLPPVLLAGKGCRHGLAPFVFERHRNTPITGPHGGEQSHPCRGHHVLQTRSGSRMSVEGLWFSFGDEYVVTISNLLPSISDHNKSA